MRLSYPVWPHPENRKPAECVNEHNGDISTVTRYGSEQQRRVRRYDMVPRQKQKARNLNSRAAVDVVD